MKEAVLLSLSNIESNQSVQKEFDKLFKEQFSLVYNYIYYYLGNAADAEDLTADIFVRAYERWHSYSPEKGSRGPWLGGIARNMLKDYFQKKSKRPAPSELSELLCANVNIEEGYIHKETIGEILAQIGELPELQQDIITMKYLLHLTNRDIARLTGMTESK